MHTITVCPRCGMDFMYHQNDVHLERSSPRNTLRGLEYDNYYICQSCHAIEQQMPLLYEEWYDLNESRIIIELAETGADREFGFDLENEFINRYQKYLKQFGSNGRIQETV